MLKQKQTKNRFKHSILVGLTALSLIILPFAAGASVYAESFAYPMKKYNVVSEFGEDRGGIYHLGEDVLGPAGTPIYSIGSGYVKHIDEHTRFGTVILIEHTLKNKSKIVSLYGHLRLSDVKVKIGQFVNKGQKIGYLGNPEENGGWVEHLHFGIRKGAYVNTWVYWGLTVSQEEFLNWHVPTKFIKGYKAVDSITYNDSLIITGAGQGGSAHVRVFDKLGNDIDNADFFAFSESFRGGADVAIGNLDKDNSPEVVVGAGPGMEPYVKIFDLNSKTLQKSILAYDKSFRGGVRVAVGDINGNGIDEIITGAGPGGGPHVRVFDHQGKVIHSKLFPWDENLRTGVDVATGDINGDGKAEIIVGAGPGGDPQVKVYDGKGNLQKLVIDAYPIAFRGGVRVTAGDVDNDGKDEIITGAGPGGGPHVRVFDADGKVKPIYYFPFHEDYRGGVDVASFDYNNDGNAEIIMSQASQGQTWIKVYSYNKKKTIISEFLGYAPMFQGGANVAAIK